MTPEQSEGSKPYFLPLAIDNPHLRTLSQEIFLALPGQMSIDDSEYDSQGTPVCAFNLRSSSYIIKEIASGNTQRSMVKFCVFREEDSAYIGKILGQLSQTVNGSIFEVTLRTDNFTKPDEETLVDLNELEIEKLESKRDKGVMSSTIAMLVSQRVVDTFISSPLFCDLLMRMICMPC